jgi:ketosteroid isomerase-like protein
VGEVRSAALVDASPIDQLLEALDRLDVEAATALFSGDAGLLTADGRRATGIEDVRQLLTAFVADLRSASHRVTGEWHQGDTWIAEFDATYVLRDSRETGPLARALVLREAPDGIADVRVYGAEEHPLTERSSGEEWGMWVRGRWIPPL